MNRASARPMKRMASLYHNRRSEVQIIEKSVHALINAQSTQMSLCVRCPSEYTSPNAHRPMRTQTADDIRRASTRKK
jgi:hypothetical protein